MLIKSLTKYDTDLFYRLYKLTQKRDCRSIIWLSKTGDGYLYFAIGMLLWAFEPEHGELFLYTALMAYALELPLYVMLKKMFKRPRPCDFLINLTAHVTPSDKFSLPSGHTAAAWLMASIVAYYYPSFTLLAYCWAALIGLSRVLLGVHYPSDVVAGTFLGITIASLSLAILG
ncbi:phosphatase PAP2 family protein [Alteromonas sp. KUL42]|uniref:phosphatase PAP2 family protein n=1 Tax=Alteromonas sp. KUL42 TaxID=2480797 RepID=UPI0010357D4E|nr:phosphatase PAP2 family protein [Alteromonas sp. KUL42]TAP35114.1 phosphatase PAP2 family protein [Alteromonas sp. KUL42]GEA07393.1 phosphatase PAP2 family protein [Alteromonas sp. KUL42]